MLSKQQTAWVIVLLLMMFITLHVTRFIGSSHERFIDQMQSLFAMEDQYYKDMFTSLFAPFDWDTYVRGQDDASEKLLEKWSAEQSQYTLYTIKSEKLFCNNLDAPFIIAKYSRRFKDGSTKCIVVVDQEQLNRPAMLFFFDSITPALNRQVESELVRVESNDRRKLYSQSVSGQEVVIDFARASVISHYLLSIREAPYPVEWYLYGVGATGSLELINRFRFADWRRANQTVRFQTLSGKPYKRFVFKFDQRVIQLGLEIFGMA